MLRCGLPSSLYAKAGSHRAREARDLARPQRQAVVGRRAPVMVSGLSAT